MKKIRNVIIFIGDGMGINSVSLARIYKGQKRVKEGTAEPGDDLNGEGEALTWESFPFTGLSKVNIIDIF